MAKGSNIPKKQLKVKNKPGKDKAKLPKMKAGERFRNRQPIPEVRPAPFLHGINKQGIIESPDPMGKDMAVTLTSNAASERYDLRVDGRLIVSDMHYPVVMRRAEAMGVKWTDAVKVEAKPDEAQPVEVQPEAQPKAA